MYHCFTCGAIFTVPYQKKETENLDGERGIETRYVDTCPYCHSDELEEVEEDAR